MTEYCVACQKRHKYHSWRNKSYLGKDGKRRYGWFCGKTEKIVYPERVPERIKKDREKHAKDIIQPWRGGYPSREFIEHYPSEAKKTFTQREYQKAKYVWRDVKGLPWRKK